MRNMILCSSLSREGALGRTFKQLNSTPGSSKIHFYTPCLIPLFSLLDTRFQDRESKAVFLKISPVWRLPDCLLGLALPDRRKWGGVCVHLCYGMKCVPLLSAPTVRGHIHACIRTGSYACTRLHFNNCMRSNTPHFDLSNISHTADRQTQSQVLWSRSCLETSSRVENSNITLNSPIIRLVKFENIQRSKQIGCWSTASFTARCVGVHFCPVMSDQKVHWKQKGPVFVSTFVNSESSN